MNKQERDAVIHALYAYRDETTHYLRGYSQPNLTHDECCPTARARAVRRDEERESLNGRLRVIDSALMELEAAAALDATPDHGKA